MSASATQGGHNKQQRAKRPLKKHIKIQYNTEKNKYEDDNKIIPQ